jgi:hypothetical protein
LQSVLQSLERRYREAAFFDQLDYFNEGHRGEKDRFAGLESVFDSLKSFWGKVGRPEQIPDGSVGVQDRSH